jgi:GAF domain-containing protein
VQVEALRGVWPRPTDRETLVGRTIIARETLHIHDAASDLTHASSLPAARAALAIRSWLGVPILREGEPIGVIALVRLEVRPFSEQEIALVQTFADQAVIAIENVRLFKELEARNTELTETLARQIATSEVLRAISQAQTDAQPVFDIIARSARRLCGAAYGQVQLCDGELIHLATLESATPEGDQAIRAVYPLRVGDGSAGGRAIAARAVVQIPDLLDDRAYAFKRAWEASGLRSLLAVPMLRDGKPIGTIGVGRTEPGPFPQTQIDLLQTFAAQAVIAIENVRLFKELEARNRDLSESLEQQTATSEILRVISSSPADVQPVFETIAANALRLCDGKFSAIFRFDGELIHLAAHHNVNPEGTTALRDAFPMPPGRGSNTARAILTGSIVHIPDVREDSEYVLQGFAQAVDYRSILSVPMLRDGQPIGVISVGRAAARPFPDEQVELLKTFADQAVIAIENVRLFKELEARTSELTRSVAELQALGEVSRAVSQTLDLDTVLATIASRAVQLSATDAGTIWEYDEAAEEFRLRAAPNLEDEIVAVLRGTPLRRGEGTVGRLADARAPIQVADISGDPAYRRAHGERQDAEGISSGGRRSPHHLRHAIRPRHPERAVLPGADRQEP